MDEIVDIFTEKIDRSTQDGLIAKLINDKLDEHHEQNVEVLKLFPDKLTANDLEEL